MPDKPSIGTQDTNISHNKHNAENASSSSGSSYSDTILMSNTASSLPQPPIDRLEAQLATADSVGSYQVNVVSDPPRSSRDTDTPPLRLSSIQVIDDEPEYLISD